ncbi:MAG TPA: tRNA (adenosine(37)-N6)-threonylcarbamoyltransferase complex ATPase subunit type 1 TsaE [Polyangiaceae bacterium]|jgi:tRNA threonylcarbamoyladenosine biosynthesis protein TsaE|nr:tRNA (adenosine(37)-N6)-threonylcarbamoyltransferase complex ATPase subunit type 1 TsaE [Polyangiaceae bacterium]
MSTPLVFDLPTRRATIKLAQRLAPALAAGDLVILSGALGAGKTFFVRALCRALGLPEKIRVTSPTFTLVQEIDTRPRIVHADLYRLSTPRDVTNLGLDSYRYNGDLLLVEWGEPYQTELGGDALLLNFSLSPRKASFTSSGPRSLAIASALR